MTSVDRQFQNANSSLLEQALVLPLPDDIALQIVQDLDTAKLNAHEIEEHMLAHFTCSGAFSLDRLALEDLRQRTIAARRILEADGMIAHNKRGQYSLTARGRFASAKQLRRITCLSLSDFINRQLSKLRLTLDFHAQRQMRESLLKEVATFIAGVGRRLTKKKQPYRFDRHGHHHWKEEV